MKWKMGTRIIPLGFALATSMLVLVGWLSLREENGFVFYRPRLLMSVIDYQVENDEWNASFNWSLDLEEV